MPAQEVRHEILASADDLKQIIGDLDDAKILEVLALKPTVLDLERASVWLSGDKDIFGPGEPTGGIAGQVVSVLTADEEDERGPSG